MSPLTCLLRPRCSAARTVPRVFAATSLLSKGILPATLRSSRRLPRRRYSPGLRRRKRAQQVLAGGSRGSISAFPRRSGCALRGGGRRGPLCHRGWTAVAAAAAQAAGGGGAGAGQESGSRGAEQAGMQPGRPARRRRPRAAGGGRAEVSPGARRGRRLSMPSV